MEDNPFEKVFKTQNQQSTVTILQYYYDPNENKCLPCFWDIPVQSQQSPKK